MLPACLLVRPSVAESVDFGSEEVSAPARRVALWATTSADHGALPFIIVDKAAGKVFVFDGQGRLRGAAPALLGSAYGDGSTPGIGQKALSAIRPEERTTPAGRFVAALAKAPGGEEILWVDYDTAIALHRVIATVGKERRLQRLESAKPPDRRITYGCINVPVKFYENIVTPVFRDRGGIVYVLPDVRSLEETFGMAGEVR
ncbi:MAG: L,D-transpeptidase [Comamonadaceae bacterium]|nr:MAG: L,D-transpeptidase [Comamonadaceae bacterium]